jgi:hypothetical protein
LQSNFQAAHGVVVNGYHSLKLARVLVRFDHTARFIVNANHNIMRAAAKLGVADCVRDGFLPAILQPTEWQRIRKQGRHRICLCAARFARHLRSDGAMLSWRSLSNPL